ncbi:MAG: helix-turn-helix domain-containing protein, partial [Planctomycetaceae bacterium]|nr:helix-turn-helix domain-containing protein [Planctomycetaceae bacterium]
MRRFEILWLHACGKFAPEIALLVRQTPPTVRGVIHMYQKGGIQLVTAMDSYHPASGPAQH